MKNNLFSIIIPLYNEKGNILPLLNEFTYFNDKYNFELILVDDGSLDGTKNILKNIKGKFNFLKIISYEKNKGYGGAILTGLELSKGDILGWIHSDLQTDVKYIFNAYDLFIKNNNNNKILIKGNRKNRKIGQVLFSNFMGVLCSIVFLNKLFEINAQPKVFPRSLYNNFYQPPTDFSLDLYLLLLAKDKGYNFLDIDVNFIDRSYGESKWNYSIKSKIKTIYRTLKYILKLRLGNKL